MAMIYNNLFPPIIDTYMPAFLAEEENCKVYFSISDYNSISEIKNVQIAIFDQNTNISVLDKDKYPSEIMLKELKSDPSKSGTDKYYITISKIDMIDNKFELNMYYKVQLRFSTVDAPIDINSNSAQAIDSWLAENLSNFSEWSTVCLIRGISKPILKLERLNDSSEYNEWNSGDVKISGKLMFSDDNETERLKSYNIQLLEENENILIDSGELFTNTFVDINELNYTLKYLFEEGEQYIIRVHYITNNLYEDTKEYRIVVIQGGNKRLNATINTILDEENARVGIHIKGLTVDKYTGNIMIRRTDSESNFTKWEDVHLERVEKDLLDFTWYDNTIKSGVWYYYCAQDVNSLDQRGIILKTRNPVIIIFDDMFLTLQDKQLNIKFDPQVSSFQRVIQENKTDTIGSKYPFIKRNGYSDYKQFQISGTISHFIDWDGLLINRNNMYESENILELYDDYNWENGIYPYNDYTYERDFREKVMDFLYDNSVKLFRSATEGNILIKLMNISFTPNQTLGRMIWTFNATAYEIDEANIDNYKKYNIINIDSYLGEIFDIKNGIIGQYQGTISHGQNLIEILTDKYQNRAPKGYITEVQYLNYLKIEFWDEPYLIYANGGKLSKVEDSITRSTAAANIFLGYIVTINNQDILVNPSGIYELSNNNLKITNLSFPYNTNIDINYNAMISEKEDLSTIIVSQDFEQKVGQLWGRFKYKDSLYKKIWDKYTWYYPTYRQNITEISNLNIEAEPGTVIYVKEWRENSYDRHIIGPTCRLSFEDENSVIEGFYFGGIHIEEATEIEKTRNFLPYNKYIETGIEVNSVDEIDKPILNGVYTILDGVAETVSLEDLENENDIIIINDKEINLYEYKNVDKQKQKITKQDVNNTNKYIYHNYKWWALTEDYDMICPVEGMVDYNCGLARGYYYEKDI